MSDMWGEVRSLEEMETALASNDLLTFLETWEVISRELMLLSERRFVSSTNAKFFAHKSYKNFSLVVHKGPKLTEGKQLRFKIHIRSDTGVDMVNWMGVFHSFKKSSELSFDNHYETSWLTLSMHDLEHFCTIASRTRVLMKEMIFKVKEDSRTRQSVESKMVDSKRVPEFFLHPVLVMMEHKRNTSTSSQSARYLVHSMTSLMSDKMGIFSEILSVPVRSIVQSVVIQRQLEWMAYMIKKGSPAMSFLHNMTGDREYFDRFHVKSIFDQSVEIEFSLVMFEIYYSNIFNQNMGMKSHREKAIVEKMAAE
jgi:hypothetical protein